MSHDFHFVLNISLKEYIIDFASVQNLSYSETIIFIFKKMKPVLEKHYLKDLTCKIGKYSKIDADTDMHVYFDVKDYRYLRQTQSNLYIFSSAIILRWMLEQFFLGLIKYGFDEFLLILEKYDNIHFIRNKADHNYKKKLYRAEKHMFPRLDFNDHVKVTYNKDYLLLSIEFL